MSLINYQGDSKLLKRICQLLKVTDVQDGEGHSLVDSDGIAVVTGGSGGSSTLAGLSDVDTTGASAGDVLAYNGTSQKWEDKGLASVATSGSYNDLSNKPTIPAAQVNSDWNASSGVAEILNKPTLATVATSGSYSDLSGKPTKLSDFSNDEGFIDNTVNNLTNYYKKTETYTQAEVDALISAIITIDIEVVSTLPTTDISTTTIYLVPKTTAGTDNVYDEYINTTGTSAGWELIGSTQVDLSNYYTKSEVDALIPDELADLSDDSTHRLVTDTEKTAWSAKVDDNPTFSEASTRANIDSGDSFATILGKIKKFFTDLKTVAFTGSYSDLSNQPTIPSVSANPSTTTATLSGIEIDGTAYAVQSGSANVQSDWNETDTTADDYIKNKPSLATVATSGSYNDLSNTPTIPTAVAVKGDAESSYRTGNVNLTPANIGAIATSDRGNTVFKVDRGASHGTSISGYWAAMLNASGGGNPVLPSSGWWHVLSMDWSGAVGTSPVTAWCSQLAIPTQDQGSDPHLHIRVNTNQDIDNSSWVKVANASDIINNAVTQTNTLAITTENRWYRLLYSGTADDTTRTEGARKGIITFNPMARTLAIANTNSYLFNCGSNKSVVFYVDGDASHGLTHRAVNGDANQWGLMPYQDGWLSLGHGSYRWGQIYSTNAAISTSDRNEKKDILPLDEKAKDFIMALNPVSFKFIDGKTGRTHYGMIAQDVEEVMSSLGMTDMDFAGFCKDQKIEEHYIENEDGTKTPDFKYLDEYRYGLRYEEFIAPVIKTEQLQQEDINSLKEEVALLKEEIALLKQRLQILEN